jgi:LysR family transcriptional regulator, hypochlorite-specific transcription factor HypT
LALREEADLRLDLEWLEGFLEVADPRSFTLAAQSRGVNQSSLSRRIQSLELWLGTDLLNREITPLELTRPGHVFLPEAKNIVATARDAHLRARQAAPPKTIRIYTIHTLAATFVPVFIRTIRKEMHDDEFEMKTSVLVGTISECVEAISYGADPFMISYESPKYKVQFRGDVPTGKIESIRIARDRLIPVCATRNYQIYTKMLKSGTPQIPYSTYSEGTYLSHFVEEKINDLGLKERLKRVDDAQMADTLRNLVREDQGIAWVLHSTARHALKEELKPFEFGQGKDSHIDLDITLFHATDDTSPIIERIWKILKTLEKQLSPNPDTLS